MNIVKIIIIFAILGTLVACDGRSKIDKLGLEITDPRLAQCTNQLVKRENIKAIEEITELHCSASYSSAPASIIRPESDGPGSHQSIPVKNIDGLEKLTNLEVLDLSTNLLENIDLSPFSKLHTVNLATNFIQDIDLSNNTQIKSLNISHNPLTQINLTGLDKLQHLAIAGKHSFGDDAIFSQGHAALEGLTPEDFYADIFIEGHSTITALNTLMAMNRSAVISDFSSYTLLESINVYNSSYRDLDLTANKNIKTVYASGNPLEYISLHDNAALEELKINQCNLTELPQSLFGNARLIEARNNKLTQVELTDPDNIVEKLYLSYNMLESINISHQNSLRELHLDHNSLSDLDITGLPNLNILNIENNNLTNLISTSNSSNNTTLQKLNASGNSIKQPDLSNLIGLQELRLSEATNAETMDFSNFSNLTLLDIGANPSIKSLILPRESKLRSLDVADCQLADLDITQQLELNVLNAKNNNLTSLDITESKSLLVLYLDNNNITQLDTPPTTELFRLTLSVCYNRNFQDANRDDLMQAFPVVAFPNHLPYGTGGCN